MTFTKAPEAGAPLVKWALWYAENGVEVAPAAVNGKIPVAAATTPGGTDGGFNAATTDPEQIRRYWDPTEIFIGYRYNPKTRDYDRVQWYGNPQYNIAIRTGNGSGGLTIIDIDTKHQANGENALQEYLQQTGAEIPETVEVLTPHAGRHIWIKNDMGRQSYSNKAAGVDIRASGACAIAPPSKVNDADGAGVYQFEASSWPDETEIISLTPDLEKIITHFRPGPNDPGTGNKGSTTPGGSSGTYTDWRDTLEGVGRHSGLISLAGKMRAANIPIEAVEAAIRTTNSLLTDPLDAADLEKTIISRLDKTFKYDGINNFYLSEDSEEYQARQRERFKNWYSETMGAGPARITKPEPDPARQEPAGDDLAAFWNKATSEAYKPIATGFKAFDNLLETGVVPQSVLTLLAAPGTGKTTLCQMIGECMAEHGHKVIYICLEMSKEQMIAKALSGRLARKAQSTRDTLLTATQILQGYKWTDKQRADMQTVLNEYREQAFKNIRYVEMSSDIDSIIEFLDSEGKAATAAGRPGPVVILDYLHLLTTTRKIETAELIKQAMKALKDYSIAYNTFVISISAINRMSYSRISLSSGRDSSGIEYTGDYILSLDYREIDEAGRVDNDKMAYLQRSNPREMRIRVLKSRHCAPGRKVDLYYDSANNFYAGMAGEWLPGYIADLLQQQAPDEDESTPEDLKKQRPRIY